LHDGGMFTSTRTRNIGKAPPNFMHYKSQNIMFIVFSKLRFYNITKMKKQREKGRRVLGCV